jgi:hypothetical protein
MKWYFTWLLFGWKWIQCDCFKMNTMWLPWKWIQFDCLKMNTMWLLGSLGNLLFIRLKMNTMWLLENEYNMIAWKWIQCDYLTCLEFFFEVGQLWLANTQSSWRGRPETAMGGSLLSRAAPLLLPCARRWEALATIAPLFLPHARKWEALAAIAPLLLLHPMTPVWRCGKCLLLLRHAWVTPTQPPRATMMNALTSKRWAHMNCF